MLLADGADKCIVLAITYYLSSSVLQIIDFFYRLSQKNTQEAKEISLILQGVSVFFLFFTVLRTLLLLHKILKVFLQEDAKLFSMFVSVKPPRGLNCGSGHETISQNLKYLSCSPREVFDTLGDGQKWSKVCK